MIVNCHGALRSVTGRRGRRGIMSVLRRVPATVSGYAFVLIGFGLLGAGVAQAASPAYCALYAREYTAQFTTGSTADAAAASDYRIQEQTYYQCLNMDVEPPFPDSSVYAGASVSDVLGGFNGPIDEMGEGDAGLEDFAEAPEPEVTEPAPAARQIRSAGTSASGRSEGSAAWVAWCREHYPNSFDEATGTVKPFDGPRQRCPG